MANSAQFTPEQRSALDQRNAKIRDAILVEKRKPTDVAKEFGLTPARIYQLAYPERYS